MSDLFCVVITRSPEHLDAGRYFNHYQWTAPLAIGVDDLDASHGNVNGNHANTHIPEIIGSARGYELTGNATQKAIAENFFSIITTAHSFATGGSNDDEHWGSPHELGYDTRCIRSRIRTVSELYHHPGSELNADTEESCTTYNILKVSRHLFESTVHILIY